MKFNSKLGIALAATALTAACQTSLTPDAGQATAPVASVPAMPAMPAAPMGRGARGQGQAPANLENAMSEMNRMLTAIKAESADPTKSDQTIHDILTFERDVAIAKLQTPPWAAKIADADEKAKAMASFRTMMNSLTRTLFDLEDAVNDKKPDDIKKALAQLEEIEKQGHTEFHVGGD